MTNKTVINSVSDLYNAIQNDTIQFKDALEYILKRESEAFERGYNDAVKICRVAYNVE